jgi:hypothetical protein
MVFGVI